MRRCRNEGEKQAWGPYNKFITSLCLMAEIHKIQKETKRKAFVLQEDQFLSWLRAHQTPNLCCRQKQPNHQSHYSPTGVLGSGDGPGAHVTTQRNSCWMHTCTKWLFSLVEAQNCPPTQRGQNILTLSAALSSCEENPDPFQVDRKWVGAFSILGVYTPYCTQTLPNRLCVRLNNQCGEGQNNPSVFVGC